MNDQEPIAHARSFGSMVAAYDRGRPGYPTSAVTWLTGDDPMIVLELGAGTGRLTSALVEQGHAVHATEPDASLLDVLRERVPGASARRCGAEKIPANDHSVDVVVVAQAFHWFDHARALPEIARVLKPGGHLALVWNLFDQRIPWVKRLSAQIGGVDAKGTDALASTSFLEDSPLFGEVDAHSFQHWQHINRHSLGELVESRSHIAELDPPERETKLAQILSFYDDFGRGSVGMELPYFAHCYRAEVIDQTEQRPEAADAADKSTAAGAAAGGKISDGSDTDMLLIDFR